MEDSKLKRVDIKVSKGNEYRTLIMDIYNENDFFFEAYQKAACVVTEIVSRSKQYNKTNADGKLDKMCGSCKLMNYPNNIISFCAERGQGKTSAMLSVSEALSRMNESQGGNAKHRDFWNNEAILKSCSQYDANPVLETHFEVLEPIDPTMMEESDSIIKNVISKMFKSAELKWNNHISNSFHNGTDREIDPALKDDLLRQFVNCFRGADRLTNEKIDGSKSYDDLNMLAEYGDSTNFKCSLSKLVELYLRFTSFGRHYGDSVLVIQIDDADLNIKNAHAISEEIRKYFVMPNVIVLMALNMETMRFTIEQYFLERYLTYAELGDKKLITQKCHDTMGKYIEKLMPSAHRIYIPKVDDFIRDGFNRINLQYVDFLRDKSGESGDLAAIDRHLVRDEKTRDHYQEKLISLIYKKTGIILVKPKYYLHEFLPSTMRMLNHMLTFINEMDDVIKYENGETVGTIDYIFEQITKYSETGEQKIINDINTVIDHYLANLQRFYDYFKNSWCSIMLSERQLNDIDIISRTSRGMKNQRTVELLNQYLPDDKIGEKQGKIPFSKIVDLLHNLKNQDNPQDNLHFAYAIELYYTIYFHTLLFENLKTWLNNEDNKHGVSPFADLVGLIGYSIFPISYYDKKGIRHIVIENDNETFDRDQRAVYQFLSHFLCEIKDVSPPKIYYHKSAVSPDDKSTSFRIMYECSYFDVLRPIISLLGVKDFAKDFLKDEGGFDSKIASSALRLICNTDIQNCLNERFFSDNESGSRPDGHTNVYDEISGMYEMIDTIINDNTVVCVESRISQIMEKKGKNSLFETYPFMSLMIKSDNNHDEPLTSIIKKENEVSDYIQCLFNRTLLTARKEEEPLVQADGTEEETETGKEQKPEAGAEQKSDNTGSEPSDSISVHEEKITKVDQEQI